MTGLAFAIVALFCTLLPAGMLAVNWRAYRQLPVLFPKIPLPQISLLIPARNECASIEAAVRSAMNSTHVQLEIIVLDDDSDDDTAHIVQGLALEDARVRLEPAPPLPQGWCGKQHACWTLSKLARYELMVWMDADVRLTPDALARMAQLIHAGNSGLISGFPREVTRTIAEQLIVPLIHFVLLGYLPISRMRASARPEYAAGCGQLFMASRSAYEKAGGHAAIRASLHDGLTLPRAFRRAGIHTDLFDATDIATCRMYRTFGEVFFGFAKNATEGMATVVALPVWTFLLLGHVAPWLMTLWMISERSAMTSTPTKIIWLSSLGLSLGMTAILAMRFRRGAMSWLLHPIGVVLLLVIQWYALLRKLAGYSTSWKNRNYEPGVAGD